MRLQEGGPRAAGGGGGGGGLGGGESKGTAIADVEVKWELLNVIEFNSTRKRMSVIVKNTSTGQVKLFTKGNTSLPLPIPLPPPLFALY